MDGEVFFHGAGQGWKGQGQKSSGQDGTGKGSKSYFPYVSKIQMPPKGAI